jgi:hypothetical protein
MADCASLGLVIRRSAALRLETSGGWDAGTPCSGRTGDAGPESCPKADSDNVDGLLKDLAQAQQILC